MGRRVRSGPGENTVEGVGWVRWGSVVGGGWGRPTRARVDAGGVWAGGAPPGLGGPERIGENLALKLWFSVCLQGQESWEGRPWGRR